MQHLLKLLKFITGISVINFSSIETKIWRKYYNCGHIVHDKSKCQRDDWLLSPFFSHRNIDCCQISNVVVFGSLFEIRVWNLNVVAIMMQNTERSVFLSKSNIKYWNAWQHHGECPDCRLDVIVDVKALEMQADIMENVQIVDLM